MLTSAGMPLEASMIRYPDIRNLVVPRASPTKQRHPEAEPIAQAYRKGGMQNKDTVAAKQAAQNGRTDNGMNSVKHRQQECCDVAIALYPRGSRCARFNFTIGRTWTAHSTSKCSVPTPALQMSDSYDAFTCFELHPSSPTFSDNITWDDGSQIIEDWVDGSQVIEDWIDGSQVIEDCVDNRGTAAGMKDSRRLPTPEPTMREPRRVAVEGRHRTSGLYLPGGALDSQTTESQFIAEIHCGSEDAPPDLGSADKSLGSGSSSDASPKNMVVHTELSEWCDTSILQDLAHVKVQLANTHQQLHEYVGR
ncbi:hypothetical protein C8Q79DRAFT_928355 [Trametes meyenii]|nr:hypothetical protein C8Q79DRAFT_928355 [Trametes meyenii]